ncbi:MAG: hypothetical protein GY943_20795, partial [Chloroflexi bacterium]|nr:hypothetical protein [Chloroflexota bacterium]
MLTSNNRFGHLPHPRIIGIVIIFFSTCLSLMVLLNSMNVEAKTLPPTLTQPLPPGLKPAQENILASSVSQLASTQPLGEPCGSGEQLPNWVLCLHGTIAQETNTLESIPLDGIPITITLGQESVNGTTFIHPGDNEPTYGIDISSLNPQFLQPVTLTAVLPNHTIQRQITIFPDFRTQSQQVDILIPAVVALDPASVWGHVIDFESGGAIADAIIVAEHENQTITLTTAIINEI